MLSEAFLQKLAVERCRHNLAQLCAVSCLCGDGNPGTGRAQAQTLHMLVETINRDLDFLQDNLAAQDVSDAA